MPPSSFSVPVEAAASSKVSVPVPPVAETVWPEATAPSLKVVAVSALPVMLTPPLAVTALASTTSMFVMFVPRATLPVKSEASSRVSVPLPPSMLRPPVREPPPMLMLMLSLPPSRAKL